jgi:hypothetical protein
MLEFLRSRQWIIGRRLILISIVILVAIRQYGPSLVNALLRPNPTRDIAITRAEFHPELAGLKPGWIIGFRNNSKKFTYDQIQLQATYFDDQGKVIERDKLLVHQRLLPGDEQLIGSRDSKERGAARAGTLTVLGAQEVR